MLRYFALIFFLMFSSSYAEPLKDIPPELNQYNSLLKTIQASKHQPMQGFFYIAKELEEKDIQELSAAKLSVFRKTKGIHIVDMPEPYAPKLVLDPRFLMQVAKNHGTEDDIRFFETYNKFSDLEWEENYHPYMKMHKDESDGKFCIDTESPYFYDFYAGWLKYLGGFPTIDYMGSLDIYQSYAVSQLDMYVFYLAKYQFCKDDDLNDNIDSLIEKVKNGQDDTNRNFSQKVIKAIKVKR